MQYPSRRVMTSPVVHRRVTAIVVGVLLLCAAFVGAVWLRGVTGTVAFRRLAPTPQTSSINAFARVQPAPRHLAVVRRNIVWIGPIAWETLPSGPSCYVFDSDGKLTAWCIEINDGDPFTDLAHEALASRNISVADALAQVAVWQEAGKPK